MLRIHSTKRMDQIEAGLRMAAERHGGSVLSVSTVGPALSFTVCFPDLYGPLLREDIRFAAFLPARVAACGTGSTISLESLSPREYCRLIHRPDLEAMATGLQDSLRVVMEEAAERPHHEAEGAAEHPATEDQINMRAALPQRIDCHGTKVEELAGTGAHDSQGG